jgi:hypothetical protein
LPKVELEMVTSRTQGRPSATRAEIACRDPRIGPEHAQQRRLRPRARRADRVQEIAIGREACRQPGQQPVQHQPRVAGQDSSTG